MKTLNAAIFAAALSFAAVAQAGYYCTARPTPVNSHASQAPGFGHGRTLAEARSQAIRKCLSRPAGTKGCYRPQCMRE